MQSREQVDQAAQHEVRSPSKARRLTLVEGAELTDQDLLNLRNLALHPKAAGDALRELDLTGLLVTRAPLGAWHREKLERHLMRHRERLQRTLMRHREKLERTLMRHRETELSPRRGRRTAIKNASNARIDTFPID